MELTVETSKTKDTLGSKQKILISKDSCEPNCVYFFSKYTQVLSNSSAGE